MTNKDFSGVITALVTPFRSGEVDWKSLKKLLQSQLEQGIRGFVVNGTTGESPTLELDEVKKVFDLVKGECPGPVIVGTGSNSTKKTIEMSEIASGWGADAVLVVTPYYNKPPQRGLIQHFRAVADKSKAPVILYDVPGRTITRIDPVTTAELSQHPNIIGIKDATGDLQVLNEIKSKVKKDFILLSGDDPTFASFVANGGHGIIAVASHIVGREMLGTFEEAKSGKKDAEARYQQKFSELFKWQYSEANPIGVKMALHWMGVLESPELRPPLVELDEKFHKDFKACLKNLGKI